MSADTKVILEADGMRIVATVYPARETEKERVTFTIETRQADAMGAAYWHYQLAVADHYAAGTGTTQWYDHLLWRVCSAFMILNEHEGEPL